MDKISSVSYTHSIKIIMKPTTRTIFTAVLGVAIGFSILMAMMPGLSLETSAQTENETEESEETEMNTMTNVTGPGGTIIDVHAG